MKIGIFGIDGVGGFYGGKLARYFENEKSAEIIFIARGNHLRAIQQKGLNVISPSETFVCRPSVAVENTDNCGIFDVLVVCVKTYDLEVALKNVSRNINAETIIIPMMNGIEPVELIRNKFPEAKVFQGCCYLNAFVESPGVIKFRGGFDQVLIGFPDEKKLSVVRKLFSDAGISVFADADISKQTWEKFIFGSSVSSVGSLANESFGEIIENAERKKLLENLIEELLSIANAKGIILENNFAEELIRKIAAYPYKARTSMQLDFVNGKRTEVETFTGYVVRQGEELGIEVKNYKEVYRKLKEKI